MCCRDSTSAVKRVGNSAYPRVISNLGGLTDTPTLRVAIDMIRFMNHYARSINERRLIIEFFRRDVHRPCTITLPGGGRAEMDVRTQAFKAVNGNSMGTREHLKMMYDYFAVGYANTQGFAHPNTGDTMTSVMIGGLRTVMNGDFEVFAGDLVQFYWCVSSPPLPDGVSCDPLSFLLQVL